MPVNPPDSGSPITKSSILDMYDAVRGVVNAQSPDTVTRGTFGEHHMPSIVRAAEFLNVNTPVTVNTGFPAVAPPIFDELTTYASWQTLAPYTLDNAGAGYTVSAGIVLAYASIRWSEHLFALVGRNEQELWFNFNYTVNGTLTQLGINNRMLRGTFNNSGTTELYTNIKEETVTWMQVLDFRALTPTFNFKLGVKAVINPASSTLNGGIRNCTLPNGNIGFVCLYGG